MQFWSAFMQVVGRAAGRVGPAAGDGAQRFVEEDEAAEAEVRPLLDGRGPLRPDRGMQAWTRVLFGALQNSGLPAVYQFFRTRRCYHYRFTEPLCGPHPRGGWVFGSGWMGGLGPPDPSPCPRCVMGQILTQLKAESEIFFRCFQPISAGFWVGGEVGF